MTDLRETVARQIFAICDNVFAQEVFAENAVGQILDIPEIKEALEHTCRDEELTPEQVALVGKVYGGEPKVIRITED